MYGIISFNMKCTVCVCTYIAFLTDELRWRESSIHDSDPETTQLDEKSGAENIIFSINTFSTLDYSEAVRVQSST